MSSDGDRAADLNLEVYKGPDPEYVGDYELPQVLRKAAIHRYGEIARRGKLHLQLEESTADHDVYAGPPQVRNLTERYARCRLRVSQDDRPVSEEEMRLVDLFGPVLAEQLGRRLPEEKLWAFRICRRRAGPIIILSGILANWLSGEERPAPAVEGAMDVKPGEARHQPFTLTPVAPSHTEMVEPEALGLDPEHIGRINVLLSPDVHDLLVHTLPLSHRLEEGGFLLGRVTRAGAEAHLVQVTHVTPAHQSGAGVAHFTFTGDSFLAAAKVIEERDQDELLIGWYHTHLAGIAFDMGLSSIDVDLHLATFHRPWQVAGLISLRRGERVLRFYGRDDKKLREYDQWVSDDSGKYRRVVRAVGRG